MAIKTHPVYYPMYEDKEHFIILITGGRGCEDPDTEIMMADLTIKKIKDIKVGEQVMGDDGTPRNVVSVVRGRSMMYRVHQTNAEDYIVNDTHILSVVKKPSAMTACKKCPNGRYPQYDKYSDIPIGEYMATSNRFKNNFLGYKSGSVPCKEQEVKIEPYMLGVWLGDGTSIYPCITNPDKEIVDYLYQYAKRVDVDIRVSHKESTAPMYRLTGKKCHENKFLQLLRDYDLIDNKHIPQEYISNSEEVRLQLLAGLIDTDGYYDKRGDYEITQKNEKMARQIKFIADTLGFRTKLSSKKAKIGTKDCGIVFRINISGDIYRIPCKVERKKASANHYEKRSWRVSRLSFTELGEGDYCGLFLDGNHRYLHADGTVTHNSGKSFSTSNFIERLTFEMNKDEKGNKLIHQVLLTRYTMTSANISVIPEFMEKIELDGTEKYFATRRADIENRMTGSKIMFRGIKTSSGNQTAKLKSIHGITTFVVDEAEEWTSEREFETIMYSIRQQGIQNRIIIIMNPTDSNHFIYEKYIKDTHKLVEFDGVPVQISTHPNVLHIHTSYLDNLEHLSPQFIKEAQQMKADNPERYAHIFMGQWTDVAEGAVYKKWGIVDEFPEECKKIALGVDFGFTNDPTAIVRCGIIDDRIYVDEVCYKTGMLAKDIADELKNYPREFVYADSADPRLIKEIGNHGILIYSVIKGAGSIEAGIDKIKTMELYVTKRSVNVQEELRNYVWSQDVNGNYTNVPIDQYNHCFTANTLIMCDGVEKPIKDISVGDMVLTSCGYKKVTKCYDNGIKKVWRCQLIFHDKIVEIEATPNHKIKVGNSWIKIEDLKAGMSLVLCNSSMVKNIINTRVNDTIRGGYADCTLMCGSITRGNYPRGIMSIIKMAMQRIIPLTIWKQLKRANTCHGTIKKTPKTNALSKNVRNILMRYVTLRKNGIGLKKAGSGIGNMALRQRKRKKRLRKYVHIAEGYIRRMSHILNFVPAVANQKADTTMDMMMKNANVLCVDNISSSTNMPKECIVASAEVCDYPKLQRNEIQKDILLGVKVLSEFEAPVYDIEVEQMHEFFANGVLVHNCMDAMRYYVLAQLLGKVNRVIKMKGGLI